MADQRETERQLYTRESLEQEWLSQHRWLAFDNWLIRVKMPQLWQLGFEAGIEAAAKLCVKEYANLHEMRSRPYVSGATFEQLERAGMSVESLEQAIRRLTDGSGEKAT